MRLPQSRTITGNGVGLVGRGRLFIVSAIFLLILLTISVINQFLRRLFSIHIPGPELIVQYIGDVKLFQQEHRIGKGPLVDIGQPPRVTLRRRMIRALVRMALEPYDRWYVLAHSQGTVLSFNGLMETAHALPNYLDKTLWARCQESKLAGVDDRLTLADEADMMPPRPAWLNTVDIIDRKKLFSKLHGFMTYGSPLEKFAVLWPKIVVMNKDEAVFAKDFNWFNVYDPTDPVSGPVKSFDPVGSEPKPENIPYKANGIHLWSHILYMAFDEGKTNRLVNAVTGWIYDGSFNRPKENTLRWPSPSLAKVYFALRYLIWLGLLWLLAVILVLLGGPVLSAIADKLGSFIPQETLEVPAWISGFLSKIVEFLSSAVDNVPTSPLGFILFAVAVVGIAGTIRLVAGGKSR